MAKCSKEICSEPIFEGSKVYMADRVGLDGNTEKRLIIEGVAIVCDVPGINGRAYPRHIIAREVERLNKEAVPYGRLAAELNHPRLNEEGISKDYPIFEQNLWKTCAIVEELRMDGDKLYCRMVVADGDNGGVGDKLASLIRKGYRPGYSLRGAGDTMPDGDHEVIADNYTMITIDVVGNPSFGKAAIFDSHVESVEKPSDSEIKVITECVNNFSREVALNHKIKKYGYNSFDKGALFAEMNRMV